MRSKVIMPLIGLLLMVVGAHLQSIDDFISTVVLLLGTVVLVGGLMLAAGSLKNFAILLTTIFVIVFFGIIMLSVPERFGAWQFLLFPGDVGVRSFWPSVLTLGLLFVMALIPLALSGTRTNKKKPH